jgi:hypothetical protein
MGAAMSMWDRFDDLVGGYGCLIVFVVVPLVVIGVGLGLAANQ